MDSGAGQCIFGSEEAFIGSSLRPCDIHVEGVAGNVAVRSIGTVRILLQDEDGTKIIGLLHNCLNSDGRHDLLSVSHLQVSGLHFVSLDNQDPHIYLKKGRRRWRVQLVFGRRDVPSSRLTYF